MADTLGMYTQLARQAARAAWYYGLHEASNRFAWDRMGDAPRYRPERPVPSTEALIASVVELLVSDANNVRDGIYPAMVDELGSPVDHLKRVREMFADIPRAVRRRLDRDAGSAAARADADGLPDYFVQDFHFQNGGYLSDDSARLYDVQVETLFMGAANAMRRQALRPIAEHIRGRDQRGLALADMACGTGRFLGQIVQAFPGLATTGIDLSPAYVAEARRFLKDRRRVRLIEGNVETLPLEDASQDVVACIFLFHELPRDVRRRATAEMARALKPGGLFVFIESLQWGDVPEWDGLLEAFPARFHEPYYLDYLDDDLDGLFRQAGLLPTATWTAFLSKVMVCRKAD
ncbi:MAG: class I SAM-dependent methyltransferase [Methyloligellaceae bacterium]